MTHPVLAATKRLHELLDAELGDTVSVDLGPVPGRTSSTDSLVVALPGLDDAAAVSAEVSYPSGVDRHQLDSFEISCMAQSVSGDADAAATLRALERCMELMEQVGGVLMAQNAQYAPSVLGGGLVSAGVPAAVIEPITWGRITRYSTQWVHDKKTRNHGALVVFPVAVEARRAATTG